MAIYYITYDLSKQMFIIENDYHLRILETNDEKHYQKTLESLYKEGNTVYKTSPVYNSGCVGCPHQCPSRIEETKQDNNNEKQE